MYVMFSLFYIVFYIYVKVVVVNGQKCRFRPQISIASPATSTSITLSFTWQDRPDHPISVSIEYCLTGSFVARVKWSPGANNNAPLTNYIVQYKTNHDQSLWYTMDDSIGERKSQVDLK